MLLNSEDFRTVNTSFIERLNLTIRQGSFYLSRKTLSHARQNYLLESNLDLFRCYYNFKRQHLALKFGTFIKTPAMQAGLTSRPLTFREIFSERLAVLLIFFIFYNSWLRKHPICFVIDMATNLMTFCIQVVFPCII